MLKRYTIIRTALFAGLIPLLISCDQFLGIRPKGALYPETLADYEALLNNNNLKKSTDPYPLFLTDDVYFVSEPAAKGAPYLAGQDEYIRRVYLFASGDIFDDSKDDIFWKGNYGNIYRYNVLISSVPHATDCTEEECKALIAEARLGRAFEYLGLVNTYAAPYDPKTAEKSPGVPLVLTPDIDVPPLSRASVQKCYEFILSEIKEALKDLPDTPKGTVFRASKAAGQGLLARTLLWMGDYKGALEAANAAISLHSEMDDLNKYRVVNEKKQIGRSNVPDQYSRKDHIWLRTLPYVYGVSKRVYASKSLLSIFDLEKDARIRLFFSNTHFGTPLNTPDTYIYMAFVYDNIGIGSPEMYLTAAECEARIGSVDRACTLLNEVRRHRISDVQPLVLTDREEVMREVLMERRREFAMKGFLRFVDLRRLNHEGKYLTEVSHEALDGTIVKLSPNDPRYTMPIPKKVIRINAGSLEQLPR